LINDQYSSDPTLSIEDMRQHINALIARINSIAEQYHRGSNVNEIPENDGVRETEQMKIVMVMMAAKHELLTIRRRFMKAVMVQNCGEELAIIRRKSIFVRLIMVKVNSGSLLLSDIQIMGMSKDLFSPWYRVLFEEAKFRTCMLCLKCAIHMSDLVDRVSKYVQCL